MDWDGTTWTVVAEFGLTGSAGLDFPSIWIRNSGGNTTEIGVAAHNSGGNTAIWRCGPAAESSCDTDTEFGSPQATTTVGNRKWPEVFIVPRSSTSDTFVVVENEAAATVRLLSLCGGTGSTFTEEGALPMPASYTLPTEQYMGYDALWARSQVRWDGTEFHVSYLAEKPGSSPVTYNVLRYHAAPGDLCP